MTAERLRVEKTVGWGRFRMFLFDLAATWCWMFSLISDDLYFEWKEDLRSYYRRQAGE